MTQLLLVARQPTGLRSIPRNDEPSLLHHVARAVALTRR
jgi:hypothetical protein